MGVNGCSWGNLSVNLSVNYQQMDFNWDLMDFHRLTTYWCVLRREWMAGGCWGDEIDSSPSWIIPEISLRLVPVRWWLFINTWGFHGFSWDRYSPSGELT